MRPSRFLAIFGIVVCTYATPVALAAQPAASSIVVTAASEIRNRANVLLLGNAVSGASAALQQHFADEINVYRTASPLSKDAITDPGLGALLDAKPWHVVVLNLPGFGAAPREHAARLRTLVQRIRARRAEVLWASLPPDRDRAAVVALNDAAREAMRTEEVEMADLYGAFVGAGVSEGEDSRAAVMANVLRGPLRRVLLSRSTRWAERPPGSTRDPAKLLSEPTLLASPMQLPEAKGTTAMVYRATAGEWQFNLHSFLAHHAGKFWAVWSSGRVDEDSPSQFIRYASSTDGLTWSESAVLAPDPDGEHGPWRWMASGIYVEDGRLFALGSLNRGPGPNGKVWSDARLVRFEYKHERWVEDRVVADDCVVYFPPLRIEGRDFFVWRDSRAYFYSGYAPAGTNEWTVTRMPGPMPDYRMSETGAYVDADGVVHLIIRDQGYTKRLYHSVSYDAGATWTIPVKTNYPDAASKNMTGRLSNGWFYLINNPTSSRGNARDPLAISFSRDGWTFGSPRALRKNAPPLRFKGKAKGPHSFQYSHAIEHAGKLWVIYATNKEDIEVSAYPISEFGL
jgi:hypothetical protein